jgi:hypothetical protein
MIPPSSHTKIPFNDLESNHVVTWLIDMSKRGLDRVPRKLA